MPVHQSNFHKAFKDSPFNICATHHPSILHQRWHEGRTIPLSTRQCRVSTTIEIQIAAICNTSISQGVLDLTLCLITQTHITRPFRYNLPLLMLVQQPYTRNFFRAYGDAAINGAMNNFTLSSVAGETKHFDNLFTDSYHVADMRMN